jgi:isopenicillin N synthase-like dioxygenase
MNTIDERLSIEIIRDFRRSGYSYFKLPKELVQEAESLAALLYDLDTRQRVRALATAESGVLGYYPSEIEAYEIAQNSGADISTWTGSKSRGYSSYDFIEEPSAVLGVLSVLRTNTWIPGLPVFRERALALYQEFKRLAIRLSRSLNSTMLSVSPGSLSVVDDLQGDCLSIMRILNYRKDELREVSKEHTDYEFLTLSISTDEGLEVKSPTGDWQLVPAKEQHAVLLPGDMFEATSFGYVKSSLHRARCAGQPRRAVIFFQGLPLDFAFDYAVLGDKMPRSFGDHIIAMLIRGSAHLAQHVDQLAKELEINIPASNPFRIGK